MKITSIVSSLALASSAVTAVKIDSPLDRFRIQQEFVAAMQKKPAVNAAARKMGRAEKLKKLNENLIKASRELQSSSSSSSYNGGQQTSGYYSQQSSSSSGSGGGYSSSSQSSSNSYQDTTGYYNNGQAAGGYSQSSSTNNQGYTNFLADEQGNLYFQGDDGIYYNAYGEVVQPNDQGLYPWEYDAVPYGLSSRAFKYAGCSAVKTYDAEHAASNGNPMVINTMAVFRLCPATSCNQYSITGCSKNYGEYTIDVKTYLSYILSYYDDEYTNYCEYCKPCDYDEQAYRKSFLEQCREQMNRNDWDYYQQLQQQAYQDFLDANGGSASNSAFHFYGKSPYNSGSGFNAYNGLYYNGAVTKNGVNNPSDSYGHWDYQAKSNSNQQTGYGSNGNEYNRYQGNYTRSSSGYSSSAGYSSSGAANQNNYNYNNENSWGRSDNENWGTNRQSENQAYSSCKEFVSSMQTLYAEADRSDYYTSYMQKSQGQGYDDNVNSYYDEDGNFNGYANEATYGVNDAAMADYWNAQDCCLDGSVCDACQIQAEQIYGDCDGYICGDYYDYCDSNYYGGGGDDEIDLADFLECTPYENDMGLQYYIGPHCASDHYTIALGLFSDENCLNYIGDTISLNDVLGHQNQNGDLFNFPDDCISCHGGSNSDDEQGQYGEYSQAPDSENDPIHAMCSSLYHLSAQCNTKMNNYEQVSRLMDVNEIAEEERTCTFIDNILSHSYDETGEITLKGTTFDFSEWRNPRQYGKLKLPADQAILLSFSIILCVALAAVAFSQTMSLKRGRGSSNYTPWTAKRLFRRRYTAQPQPHASETLIARRRPMVARRRPSMGDQKPTSSPHGDSIDPIPSGGSGIIATRSIASGFRTFDSSDDNSYRPPSTRSVEPEGEYGGAMV